jgi:hypothetical protein
MKFVDEIQPYKSRGREQTRRSSPRHHPIKQTQHHHQLRLQQQHTGQVFFPAFGKFNYRVTVASMNNWLMTLTSLVSRLGNWQRGVGWISPASMEGLDSIHIYIYKKPLRLRLCRLNILVRFCLSNIFLYNFFILISN